MFKQLVNINPKTNNGISHVIYEGDVLYKPTSGAFYIITEIKMISTDSTSEITYTLAHRSPQKRIKSFEITLKELLTHFMKLVYMTEEEEEDIMSIFWDWEERVNEDEDESEEED